MKDENSQNNVVKQIAPLKDDIKKKLPFTIRSLSAVKKEVDTRPPIKKLVGELIHEGEQTMLFSHTNLGKSILAYQIGKSVSQGKDIVFSDDVVLINECEPITTILFDFELSDGQFINRIGEEIPDNFHYAQIERGELLEGSPLQIINTLRDGANSVKAKFIIIDNISKISSDLEKSENAKIFMGELLRLVKHEGYTVLVIAHTPKLRHDEKLTMDSLAGSSKLGALTDSAFAIGKQDEELTGGNIYIKQLKTRMNGVKYGANNVIVGSIVKEPDGLVHFIADGFATESMAIRGDVNTNPEYKNKIKCTLLHLLNYSYRQIADQVGEISHMGVGKRIKSFEDQYPDEFRKLCKLNKPQLIQEFKSFDIDFEHIEEPTYTQTEIDPSNNGVKEEVYTYSKEQPEPPF